MDMLNTYFMTGPLVATFLLGFTTIILLFWYSSRKQSYWKERGVPFIKPTPFFGSIWENIKKPLHEIDVERYYKFGRIYGHYEGNSALLSIGEPEIIRKILVKDFHAFPSRKNVRTGNDIMEKMVSMLEGEDWKRVRTIITPTFTTGKIKRMTNIIKDCSKTLTENFKEAAEKGEPVDAKSFYGAFTMDTIASTAFSTKLDSHKDPNNEFVSVAKNFFAKSINWRIIMFVLFPWMMRLFKISIFMPRLAHCFKRLTLQIIEERKRAGQVRNDFLQLLMDTAKETSENEKLDLTDKETGDIAENYGKDENEQLLKDAYVYSKKSLSFDELVAQCITFFIAGYETTASTLAFASYGIALHPDIQEKLIKEIDNALIESNGELTYESVQSMKYLDNVISETLRLYPPAVRLERVADEDYELEDSGITIPKGMVITIPVYAMHRDPKLFPDPEKFDPDRFSPEKRVNRQQFSYLPFGAGPRNCVAMRFALMEVKVCLAQVLSKFRIRKCPQTKVPLDFFMGTGLLQPKPIILKMEIRKDGMNTN